MKKLKELFAKLVNLFSKKVKTEEVDYRKVKAEVGQEAPAEDQISESPEAPKKAKKKYYHHKPKTK